MTEHITGTLNEPLKKGELYKIKIKTKFSGEHCKFFLNRLCVRFTKAKQWIYKDAWVSYDYLVANKFTPNVFWTLDLNSSKWVTLESEYVAQGGENYISIGMFPIDKFSNELDVLKYLSLKRDGKKKKLNKFFKDNQLLLKLNESFTTASLIDVKDGAYYFIDKVSITPVCSDK
ncbi:hypothetical protein [Saccharicrinis fermentans]|nr:hypothetical protein [Saccharicrinis fermentans]